MKQGTGKSSNRAGPPVGKVSAVSASRVSEMGAHPMHVTKRPAMMKAAGNAAPKSARTQHPTGSQGKR